MLRELDSIYTASIPTTTEINSNPGSTQRTVEHHLLLAYSNVRSELEYLLTDVRETFQIPGGRGWGHVHPELRQRGPLVRAIALHHW